MPYKNIEDGRKQSRRYYSEHKDAALAGQRKYRLDHLEEKKSYDADYRLRPHAKRRKRLSTIVKTYGCSLEEAERLMSIEYCEITGDKKNGRELHIDHNHKTGKIRGVLSHRANIAIGALTTPEELRAAADYLEKRE